MNYVIAKKGVDFMRLTQHSNKNPIAYTELLEPRFCIKVEYTSSTYSNATLFKGSQISSEKLALVQGLKRARRHARPGLAATSLNKLQNGLHLGEGTCNFDKHGNCHGNRRSQTATAKKFDTDEILTSPPTASQIHQILPS